MRIENSSTWTRHNVSQKNMTPLLARIVSYRNNHHDSKIAECGVNIMKNGKMTINITTLNHHYFQQLPNTLFSQPCVSWHSCVPNTFVFHYNQNNDNELNTFLETLSNFDNSFSTISPDLFLLLTQFNHADYHQDSSSRCTFFQENSITKSSTRRERAPETKTEPEETTGTVGYNL